MLMKVSKEKKAEIGRSLLAAAVALFTEKGQAVAYEPGVGFAAGAPIEPRI